MNSSSLSRALAAAVLAAALCGVGAVIAATRGALLDAGAMALAALGALAVLFYVNKARGSVNRLMRERGAMKPAAPAFPLASAAVAPLRTHFEALGRTDCSPLWSGQNASACRAVPAADITAALAAGFD